MSSTPRAGCESTATLRPSGEQATEPTARPGACQSVRGFQSGSGLYLNYLFALAWLADVAWWWLSPITFANRPSRLTIALHSFFYFMVLNGAFVFALGFGRVAIGVARARYRPQGQAAQGPGRGPAQGPRPHGAGGNPNKRHRRGRRGRGAEGATPDGLPRDDVVRVDEES